jgi:hypothetical protein
MVRTVREDLLQASQELRYLCSHPVEPRSSSFADICRITTRVADLAATPEIAGCALEVRLKAEDLFQRPHQMPESVLRHLLVGRLQHLDALIRASSGTPRNRRAAGVHGRRASDRQEPGPG